MASLDQIELPDGSNYNLSVPYIVGTGSTAGTWLGALDNLTAYYDGLLILYKPSVAGAATTTLNINGIGAKTIYTNGANKLTTHYSANQPILLVYSTSQNSGCWMCIDNYWANTLNTAGATDTSDKIFLVGAKTQTTSTQTYTHDTAYVGTDGCLYSNGIKTASTPYGEASGAIATFSDGSDLPVKELIVDIDPIQDLHGYDYPWVGGAGKNKLPMTVSGIKSLNTEGTWNGNAYTVYGITYTLITDSDDNIIQINVKGKATGNNGNLELPISGLVAGSEYILSGCPSGGSASIYRLAFTNSSVGAKIDYGSGVTFTYSSGTSERVYIRINQNYEISGTLVYKPMIRLSSVSDATFAPYSNICSIIGRTETNITDCGKNYFSAKLTDFQNGTVYGSAKYIALKLPYNTYTISTNAPTGNVWAGKEIPSGTSDFTRVYDGTPKTVTTDILYIGLARADLETAYSYNTIIEVGSQPTTYAPYNGSTYTIQLGSTYYGCTLNVTTGLMVVKNGYKNLGDSTWEYNGTRFKASITGITNKESRDKGICSNYTVFLGSVSDAPDKSIVFGAGSDIGIYIKDSSYSDASTFKTAMNGVQLVYELATPIEIQLTPTQINTILGKNNLYADSGDINKVVYVREEYSGTAVNSVIQTATTTDADYEVLFSGTADNTTRSEGAKKSGKFTFNPNTRNLNIGDMDNVGAWANTRPQIGIIERLTGSAFDQLNILSGDIELTASSGRSNTWDGTNTSLKSALAAKGTSNLTIGTTATTAMAGNTAVNNVLQTQITNPLNITYPILFSSYDINEGTITASTKKINDIVYNPMYCNLKIRDADNHLYTETYHPYTDISPSGLGVWADYEDTGTYKYMNIGDDDILLEGSNGYNWAGISTSLQATLTQLYDTNRGNSYYTYTGQLSSELTTTGDSDIYTTGNNVIGHGRPCLFIVWGTIKTNTNSAFLQLFVNSTKVCEVTNSLNSYSQVTTFGIATLPDGVNNITIRLHAQNASTTAAMSAYRQYGYVAIEL